MEQLEFAEAEIKSIHLFQVVVHTFPAAFFIASSYCVRNFLTSTNMFETRAPAVFPAPTLTVPRGCFAIRYSRAAKSDLSTILGTEAETNNIMKRMNNNTCWTITN